MRHNRLFKGFYFFLVLGLATLGASACGTAATDTPGVAPVGATVTAAPITKIQVKTLQDMISTVGASVNKGDYATALSQYTAYDTAWDANESGVKTISSAAYAKIEDDMTQLKGNLSLPAPDQGKTQQAVTALQTDLAALAAKAQ